MAMTWGTFQSRAGGRWKPRSVRAGNSGIQAPGSASKTPSSMAGRLSVATSKPVDHREEGGGPSGIKAPVLQDPGKGALVLNE